MRLPVLQPSAARARKQVVAFGGINYTAEPAEGELRHSQGLSTALYPALSQRQGRRRLGEYTAPTALFAKGKLCVVDGGQFYYDGRAVGTVTPGKKEFAAMGSRVIIFPDKAYYDVEAEAFGSLEESYTGEGLVFTASTIEAGGGLPFRPGDAIEITGCTSQPENNKTVIVREAADRLLTFYNNSFTPGEEAGAVTLARRVPELHFICEAANRLWGVSGQTIYGSALGDPFNFFKYDGLATDSYAVAVGTDGPFTGVMPYASHICFFKEDVLHKLYGNRPANYQVNTAQIQGVQQGSGGSLRVMNETLFYKGRGGVYAYTGGVPDLITPGFGAVRFGGAVAEGDGERYYISMTGQSGTGGLYAYDVLRGLWIKEDDTLAEDFACLDGVVYFIADGAVWAMGQGADSSLRWMAELAPFHERVNDKKGYSRLSARIDLEEGAWLAVDINLDGQGWRNVYKSHNARARTVVVPLRPARCDSFSIRFSGKGGCRIRSLTRDFYQGSDVG